VILDVEELITLLTDGVVIGDVFLCPFLSETAIAGVASRLINNGVAVSENSGVVW
jgi:hypothetical protein